MNLKKTGLFILLILIVAVGTVFAQTRIITFYAYGAGINSPTPGHAFVRFADSGTYGFYPQKGFFGSVGGAGVIRDDGQNIRRAWDDENGVISDFVVTEAQFQAAYSVYLRWARNPGTYTIGYRDCINFVYEVAEAIGLRHDSYRQNMTVWPTTAVGSIKR